MSKDNVKQMFGKMEKDANLQKKYTELMQIHQKETENKMAEKLIELGRTSGFIFSKDDLLSARAEIMDTNNSNKELADNDLENVAGGGIKKTDAIVCSILSLGYACAVGSIEAEQQSPGGCGALLSTNGKC